MSKQFGYAFNWLQAPNAIFDTDFIPEQYLKDAASLIDWNAEPEENRPDFENDNITVIRAKLKTVEDKINTILEG